MRAADYLIFFMMSAELAWKRALKKVQLRRSLGVDNIRHGLQLHQPTSADNQDCCTGERYGDTKHREKKEFHGKRQEHSGALLCLNQVH